jgi:hypothetical protein
LRGQEERYDRIAHQSQCQKQTGLRVAKADADKIENENDGNQSIREKTGEARQEQ